MVALRHQLRQAFGQLQDNAVGLERSITEPVTEGLNHLLASFYTLYHQYQKHHWVVEGTEFGQLHETFDDYAGETRGYAEDLGERIDGLGAVPVSRPARLQEMSCFQPEDDGVFDCRTMLVNDLGAEQSIIKLLRQQIAAAGSLGDYGTEHYLKEVLLKTEERAFHLAHYLADDSLVLDLDLPTNGSR
ncbi:DNA starvation/stationary phase protection protein DpsA [Gloeobacter violaceus]|uniref:Glr2566 protein n=1 Tax=Gloeobacter violaceus (strain ATCC 29082 / PCC 7421) TaxID=251221 RepID=Q7NHH1_GLOVI|nr:DNA starvation/stationary phase protection protein DpsA [Gloeobacter violaceus]BAC90507.1 glr2566 [Gloeobacter violaceus PCC 7421]